VLLLVDPALGLEGERAGPPSPKGMTLEERFVLALFEVDVPPHGHG
jgi:hypothetical protein